MSNKYTLDNIVPFLGIIGIIGLFILAIIGGIRANKSPVADYAGGSVKEISTIVNDHTDPITGISYQSSSEWLVDSSQSNERERNLYFSRAMPMSDNILARKSSTFDTDLSSTLFRVQLTVDEYQFQRVITKDNKSDILNEEHGKSVIRTASQKDRLVKNHTSTSTITSFAGNPVEALTTDSIYILDPVGVPGHQRIISYIENNKIYSIRYMAPEAVWATYVTQIDNMVKSIKIPKEDFKNPVYINS